MTIKDNIGRRKLLFGLTSSVAGASQLPGQWTRPIVYSVLLPAHAQTSTTTTTAPTTPAPTTTPVACIDPVLDSGNVTVANSLVLTNSGGQTSGGTATTQITNSSSVAISLSYSLVVTPPDLSVSFSVTLPSQLQPGQSASLSIYTADNLCQFFSTISLQITAISLDPVCQGNVVLDLNVGYIPLC